MHKIFPKVIDNQYQGHKLALYVFYPFTLMTIGRSLVHMLAPDGGAQSIATIPLNTYSAAAANNIVSIFALWGLSQLLLGLVFALVVVRYRSLLSLMYLLVLLEYSARLILLKVKPIVTISTAPGDTGNYIFVPLALVMLFLSTTNFKSNVS